MTSNNSWLTILEQGTYWVPRAGWGQYLAGTALEDLIDGVEKLELTTMDPEYLRRLPAFILERYIDNHSDECYMDEYDSDITQVQAWESLIERPLMQSVLRIMATDGYVTWPAEFVVAFTADVTQAALTTIGVATRKPFDPNGPLPSLGELERLLAQQHKNLSPKVIRSLQALKSAQRTERLTQAGAGEAAWTDLTQTARMAGEFMPNDMRRVFLADAFHPNKAIEATQLVATGTTSAMQTNQ